MIMTWVDYSRWPAILSGRLRLTYSQQQSSRRHQIAADERKVRPSIDLALVHAKVSPG